jgi:hypothetical protein
MRAADEVTGRVIEKFVRVRVSRPRHQQPGATGKTTGELSLAKDRSIFLDFRS